MARNARTVIRLTGNFFGIPNQIIDTHGRSLGVIGVGVYTALARYADRKTGECWPAIAKLEHVLGMARSTVKVYLHKLEAAGLIVIEERWAEAGDRTSNLYILLDPSPAAIARHLAARAAEEARAQECAGSVASFRLRRFVVWSPSNPCCKGGARRWRSASKGPISHQTLF